MKQSKPHHHQGQSYVQLGLLPNNQKEAFINWLPEAAKIQINDAGCYNECASYTDYTFWLTYFYRYNDTLENQI